MTNPTEQNTGIDTLNTGMVTTEPIASATDTFQPAPQGSLLLGVVGAVGGAGVGALVWFLLEYYVGVQVGWIAILCGILAGSGAVALGRRKGFIVGVIAALAGLGGILGGSYAAYYAELHGDKLVSTLRESFNNDIATNYPNHNSTEEEKEETFQEWLEEIRNSEDLSYANLMKDDPKNLIFMGLFGFIGMGAGFRIACPKEE